MKYLLAILLVFTLLPKGSAQAPVFSQYYAAGLYTNPAWAGLEKDLYLGMNYRNQWSSVSLPFSTFQFTYIQPLVKPGGRAKHVGGIATTLLNDVAGDREQFKTQSVTVGGSYNFHLNRHGNELITVGMQAGGAFEKINASALEWSSRYSPASGFEASLPGEDQLNTQVFYPLVNAGAVYLITTRSKNPANQASLYQGASVFTMLNRNRYFEQSSSKSYLLFKIHGGFGKAVSRRTELSGNYLIQYMNGANQINAGVYLTYLVRESSALTKGGTKVSLGGWYRLKDAWITSLGILNGPWNIGFSYDGNLSSLGRSFGYAQTYEFSLAYRHSLFKGTKRFSSPLI